MSPGSEKSRGEIVLVVDDEPGILKLTSSILAGAGYNVLAAQNGMDAIDKSRGREFEIALLLTDVVMDDLNGPNLADYLRGIMPSMRVLFMSGWEPNVIAHQGAFRLGFRTVTKPFTPASLLDAVRNVLEEPSSVAESGAKRRSVSPGTSP